MDQKAKRRHPNFFDILLIVLIIIVVAAAYFLSHAGSAGQTTVTRTYQIELTTLQEGMEDCVAVGDTVTDTVKNYGMGTVTAIEIQPEINTVTDEEDGVVRHAAVDGYFTMLLTVEAETTESEKDITTSGGYVIRTGTAVSCSVGTLVGTGYILEIQR